MREEERDEVCIFGQKDIQAIYGQFCQPWHYVHRF